MPHTQPWLVFLIAFVVLLLLPGFLFSLLVFGRSGLSLVERLPISLALGIGLFVPMGLLSFVFQLSLDLPLAYLLALNLALSLGLALPLRRRGWPALKLRLPTSETSALPLFGVLLLLIIVAVVINLTAPRFSDNLAWLAYVRRYLDLNHLSPEEPFMGTGYIQPRTRLAVWLLLEALVAKLAGLDPVPVVRFMLPAALVVISLLAFFALTRAIIADLSFAAFATSLQVITYLGWQFPGEAFFSRLSEDKMVAWLVLYPVVVLFMLRFLGNGGRGNLAGFALSTLSMAVVNPVMFVFCPLALGSLALIQLLFQRERSSRLRLGALGGVVTLGLPIPAVLSFEQRGVQPSLFSGDFGSAVAGRMLRLVEAYDRLIFLPDGSFLAHPNLILQPVIVAALLMSPLLLIWIKRSLAARYLLSNAIIPLVLIYNPITAPLLGRVITTGMVYRISWMVPTTLIISFVTWKALALGGRYLARSPLPGRRTIERALPFLALLLITLAAGSGIYQQHQERNRGAQRWLASPEEEELLFYLRANLPTGATIMANHRLNFFISAYLNASVIEFRRAVGVFPEAAEEEAQRRDEDVTAFYATELVTSETLAILKRYDVDYLVVNDDAPVSFQVANLPYLFPHLHTNQRYHLYSVAEHLDDEPVVLGNDSLAKGKWLAAGREYRRALKRDGDDLLGNAGLAETQLRRGRYHRALVRFRKAVSLAPELPWLRLSLGRALLGVGKPGRALTQLRRALELGPDRREQAAIHLSLGDAYAALGRMRRAVKAYRTAIGLDPGAAAAYSGLALIREEQGKVEQAVKLWDRLLALQPEGKWARLAHSHLGELVAIDFLRRLERAGASAPEDAAAEVGVIKAGRTARNVILAPPPCRVSFLFNVPRRKPILHFGIAIDPEERRQGGEPPQAIFKVRMGNKQGSQELLLQKLSLEPGPKASRWLDFDLDLAAFAGQRVRITFVTEVPPGAELEGFRAGWSRPHIIAASAESEEQ